MVGVIFSTEPCSWTLDVVALILEHWPLGAWIEYIDGQPGNWSEPGTWLKWSRWQAIRWPLWALQVQCHGSNRRSICKPLENTVAELPSQYPQCPPHTDPSFLSSPFSYILLPFLSSVLIKEMIIKAPNWPYSQRAAVVDIENTNIRQERQKTYSIGINHTLIIKSV